MDENTISLTINSAEQTNYTFAFDVSLSPVVKATYEGHPWKSKLDR